VSYRNIAIDAISKMTGYDPYLPKSEAMVLAYAEALQYARLNDRDEVLQGVRLMYELHGDPGWKPTPKALVRAIRDVRNGSPSQEAIGDGVERVTYAEFRRRHPDVEFPATPGRKVPDA